MHRTGMVEVERAKRQEWEAQYVSDYVARRYAGLPVRIHARLGTPVVSTAAEPLLAAEERMLRVKMRWADAIVFSPSETIVIEGKLRASEMLKAIGELELYTRLVPLTPDFKDLVASRVVGELLVPGPDPTVELLAREKGFRFVQWAPEWLQDYLGGIAARAARPIRPSEAGLL